MITKYSGRDSVKRTAIHMDIEIPDDLDCTDGIKNFCASCFLCCNLDVSRNSIILPFF